MVPGSLCMKSDVKENIDGITDYWYRCHGGGWYWVFGAYLSTTMPEDTDSVLGYWNTDRGERYYWYFWPDYTVSTGKKETSGDWKGYWTLSDDKLTIKTIPTEFNTKESETLQINVTIINRNRIILNFTDGSRELLERNNNVF